MLRRGKVFIFRLQQSKYLFCDHMTLNMKTLHSSETSVAMLRWYKIPDDSNIHVFTLGLFGRNSKFYILLNYNKNVQISKNINLKICISLNYKMYQSG